MDKTIKALNEVTIRSNETASLSNQKDEMSVKELILAVQTWTKYILTRWKFVLVMGLVGAIFGILYSLYFKPIYSASTSFVLEEGGGGGMLGQYAGIASIAGINLGSGGGGLFEGDNIFQLYKSRTMIEKTLFSEFTGSKKKQLFLDKYIQMNGLESEWNKEPKKRGSRKDLPGRSFTEKQEGMLSDIVQKIDKAYLSVSKPEKTSSIIMVQIRSNDEVFAKLFNDKIVQNVNDFYVQTKTKKAIQNVEILQHQTDSVKAVLNGAIYKTVAVSDATPNLNPTRQVLRSGVQLSQVNIEANKAILSELVKNLELAKLSYRKETPLIQVVDEPVYPLNKERFGKLKGLLLGGILFGFMSIIIVVVRKSYRKIFIDEEL